MLIETLRRSIFSCLYYYHPPPSPPNYVAGSGLKSTIIWFVPPIQLRSFEKLIQIYRRDQTKFASTNLVFCLLFLEGYLVINGSHTSSVLNSPMYKPVSSNTCITIAATIRSSSNGLNVYVRGENGSAIYNANVNMVVNDTSLLSFNVSSTERIWLEFNAYIYFYPYTMSLLSVNVTDGPCAVTGWFMSRVLFSYVFGITHLI